jgi:hypothetical protein
MFGNKRHKPITHHNHPQRHRPQQPAHGFQLNLKINDQLTFWSFKIGI